MWVDTYNVDDSSSILLGASSTIFERNRLFELRSNNSLPQELLKGTHGWQIYHSHQGLLLPFFIYNNLRYPSVRLYAVSPDAPTGRLR